MKILRLELVTRNLLKANPHMLFLFGDNEQRQGLGGQAKEMRGEPNAIGIRTKKAPLRTPEAYWNDKDYLANIAMVDQDMLPVERHLALGGVVVMPAGGIGTGLSQMGRRCPKTFLYLCGRIDQLIKTYGQTASPALVDMRIR